jgi:hypothetical protein
MNSDDCKALVERLGKHEIIFSRADEAMTLLSPINCVAWVESSRFARAVCYAEHGNSSSPRCVTP